jgi:hypothetical protein
MLSSNIKKADQWYKVSKFAYPQTHIPLPFGAKNETSSLQGL